MRTLVLSVICSASSVIPGFRVHAPRGQSQSSVKYNPYDSQEVLEDMGSLALRLLAFNSPTVRPQKSTGIHRQGGRHASWHDRRCGPARLALEEDAVAERLAALKRGGKRRARRQTPEVPEGKDFKPYSKVNGLPCTEDVPVWTVPERLRVPNAPPISEHGYHVSLESMFPGTGLADAWDTSGELRTAMRQALRDDLLAPLAKNLPEKRRAAYLSLIGGCKISWVNALRAEEEGKISFDSFNKVFQEYGVNLDGRTFLSKFGELVGEEPLAGTLVDIVPLVRKKRCSHKWHQEVGKDCNIVLLGFPLNNSYVGGGIFSNFVKISHPLRPAAEEEQHNRSAWKQEGEYTEWVEFEELNEPNPTAIPDEYVFRPTYSKGREVWVSNDALHLIAEPPDRQARECMWRFM